MLLTSPAYFNKSLFSNADEINPTCVDLKIPKFFVTPLLIFVVNFANANNTINVDISINKDALGSTKMLIKIKRNAIIADEKACAIGVINKFTKVDR